MLLRLFLKAVDLLSMNGAARKELLALSFVVLRFSSEGGRNDRDPPASVLYSFIDPGFISRTSLQSPMLWEGVGDGVLCASTEPSVSL